MHLPHTGIDERVPQASVGAEFVVVEGGLELEAGAFGYPCALVVAGVAPDLDSSRAQGLDGQGGYGPYRFGNVALARVTGAAPVADLELRYVPVYVLQP